MVLKNVGTRRDPRQVPFFVLKMVGRNGLYGFENRLGRIYLTVEDDEKHDLN